MCGAQWPTAFFLDFARRLNEAAHAGAMRAPVADAVGTFGVFIGCWVVIETKPATPVSRGGRGVENSLQDERGGL